MEWYCKLLLLMPFFLGLSQVLLLLFVATQRNDIVKNMLLLCIIAFCLSYKCNVSSLWILMYVNVKQFSLFVFIYKYGFAS